MLYFSCIGLKLSNRLGALYIFLYVSPMNVCFHLYIAFRSIYLQIVFRTDVKYFMVSIKSFVFILLRIIIIYETKERGVLLCKGWNFRFESQNSLRSKKLHSESKIFWVNFSCNCCLRTGKINGKDWKKITPLAIMGTQLYEHFP